MVVHPDKVPIFSLTVTWHALCGAHPSKSPESRDVGVAFYLVGTTEGVVHGAVHKVHRPAI